MTADGQRFLMMKQDGVMQGTTPSGFVVVQNWFEELARLVTSR